MSSLRASYVLGTRGEKLPIEMRMIHKYCPKLSLVHYTHMLPESGEYFEVSWVVNREAREKILFSND